MLTTLTEKLSGLKAEKKSTAENEYDFCTHATADGNETPIERIDASISGVGKTLSDFERDVTTILDRREDAKLLATLKLDDIDADVSKASAVVIKATEVYEAAEKSLLKARNDLATASNIAQQKRRQLNDARARLLKTCPDAEALEALGVAINERERITLELSQARQRLGNGGQGVVGSIPQLEGQIAQLPEKGADEIRIRLSAQLAAHKRERGELETKIPKLEKSLSTASAAVADAERVVFNAK